MPPEYDALLDRARRYCAYQERCEKDVTDRLLAWKTDGPTRKKIIKSLKEEGFINEERFCKEYVSGKFRNNQWGKFRISLELKRKNIPEEMILKALDEISDEEIRLELKNILGKRAAVLEGDDHQKKIRKLIDFAVRRGYPFDMTMDTLRELKILE